MNTDQKDREARTHPPETRNTTKIGTVQTTEDRTDEIMGKILADAITETTMAANHTTGETRKEGEIMIEEEETPSKRVKILCQ